MTNTEKPWPFPGADTRPTEAQTRANDLETPDGDSEEVTDEATDEDIGSAPGTMPMHQASSSPMPVPEAARPRRTRGRGFDGGNLYLVSPCAPVH